MSALPQFAHLHVHTPFSLLDGAAQIPRLVTQAKKLGMKHLAITDHGVLHGVVPFYRLCRKVGIHPIIGCEVYVTRGRMHARVPRRDDRLFHLVLLAENETGYRHLLQLVTKGHLEGFYYKPRVDKQLLAQYSDGLIALSGCLAGEVSDALRHSEVERATELAVEYRRIFGEGNFFLELQDHGLPEQKKVNQYLIQLSEQTGIPLVATNDVHYITRDDSEVHDCLLCIGTGTKLGDNNRFRFLSDQYYLKSPEEMTQLFPHVPEAVANTVTIAERCQVELTFGEPVLPSFPLPPGTEAKEVLRTLAFQGVKQRYGKITDDVRDRLEHELTVIDRMGFNDYFLIVWDFVRFAREQGIAVGPGRGSAAGSLVAYALFITDIDPLKYGLLFERFLNSGRHSLPDIDIDFNDERRDEVIRYVVQKYGADRVAHIATFGTLAPRAAVRDVGRVMDLPYRTVDRAAKCIPNVPGMSMEKALRANHELAALVQSDRETARLIDRARQLEGLPRHVSTHAAGVVITPEPLVHYVPLMRGSEEAVSLTQYPMEDLEAIGLLKIDILGLRNLTVIERTVQSIARHTGKRLSFADIGDDDEKTYALLGRGETAGVFQLESAGMRRVLKELRPTRFEDIIAVLALYRPGPMDQIATYIAAKHGKRKVTYLHPDLEPILRDTFGIIVYQEQIMQIAAQMAGFSLEEADLLRRAVGKKERATLLKQRERFVSGCVRQGYAEALGGELYDLIVKFADYGFNRAHAAAYAVLAYQTAYLKAHYPLHFMAALLTTVMGNRDKLAEYVDDCRKMGITIRPPDVNFSDASFTVEGDAIRYGLLAIKNVGVHAIESIVKERRHPGYYRHLFHLLEIVDPRACNRRVMEALILSGATASLPGHRAQQLANLDEAMEWGVERRREQRDDQLTLFASGLETEQGEMPPFISVEPFPRQKELALERELLGMYLTGHPLERFRDVLRRMGVTPVSQLADREEGRFVHVAGLITHVKRVTTKRGEWMAFVTLVDTSRELDVVVFPRLYEGHRERWKEDALVLIGGKIHRRDDEVSVIAEKVQSLDQLADVPKVYIRISGTGENNRQLRQLKTVISRNRGPSPVYLYDESAKRLRLLSPEKYGITWTEQCREEIEAIFGEENIKIK